MPVKEQVAKNTIKVKFNSYYPLPRGEEERDNLLRTFQDKVDSRRTSANQMANRGEVYNAIVEKEFRAGEVYEIPLDLYEKLKGISYNVPPCYKLPSFSGTMTELRQEDIDAGFVITKIDLIELVE